MPAPNGNLVFVSPKSAASTSPPADTPSFPGWPILGALPHVQADIIGTFERAAQLGDVVQMQFPRRRCFLITHPDGVRRVLVENQRNYGKKTRGYRILSLALGNGLVTSQGAHWRRQRRIAQPAFHHQRISGLLGTMDDAARALVERWRSRGDEHVVAVDEEMMRVTLEIVGRALLSIDLSDETDAVGAAITVLLKETVWRITHPLALPLRLPTRRNLRLRSALRRMDVLVADVIAARRRGPPQQDLLSMLIDARDEDTGAAMTDEQLRDEVLTMVSAGHETTAVSLTWAFDLLAGAPAARARLEEEIATHLDDEPLDLARLARLEWTEAVIKETMRLRPPVWMLARSVIEDDVILGHPIAAKSTVFLPQFIMHRDPRYWDEPEAFKPERFIGEAGRAIPRHVYFPFAEGPRICIGQSFAMMEAKTLLARLVQSFAWQRIHAAPAEAEATITQRPKHGLKMRISAKNQRDCGGPNMA